MNKWTTAFLVSALFLLSFAMNAYNNGFDYRLHCDEPKKVYFIQNDTQDFKHPLLMLQVSRVINAFTGYESKQDIVVEGRYASAFMGACIVVGVFFLSRRLLSPKFAFLATLSVAVSPMVVIHAHYLKEDVYFTAPFLFSLLFLIKMIESRKRAHGMLFGLFLGLALSAQYKSFLFFPILALLPIVDRRIGFQWYIKELFLSLAVAGSTFLIINYNIFYDIKALYYGMQYEAIHAKRGHEVRAYPLDNLFLFHFRHSLIPGLTLSATVAACLGCINSAYRWKRSDLLERTLLLCIVLFYFAHEISPLKPAPAFVRYMVPIAPLLIIFGWLGAERAYLFMSEYVGMPVSYATALVAFAALTLFPAYDTANLTANLVDDTRIGIDAKLKALPAECIYELFVLPGYRDIGSVFSAGDLDIEREKQRGVCYVATSSMSYDRFYYGAVMKDQDESVYKRHAGYERLFRHPFVEIRPKYRTFAFSNPTIRIVDICAD